MSDSWAMGVYCLFIQTVYRWIFVNTIKRIDHEEAIKKMKDNDDGDDEDDGDED